MAEQFNDLEEMFMYREFIVADIFKAFPKETHFITKTFGQEENTKTIDSMAESLFSDKYLYWMILFFNPSLDIIEFGIKNGINEHDFLKNKLEYVYKTNLNKPSYTTTQIEKVFDTFHTYQEKSYIVPKPEYVISVKKYIINAFQKIYKGSMK